MSCDVASEGRKSQRNCPTDPATGPGHKRGSTAKIKKAPIRRDRVGLSGLRKHGVRLPLCPRAPNGPDRCAAGLCPQPLSPRLKI